MSYADLKDRVYVVTGASKGMGRDLAIRLAQQGAHLGLIDLKEPKETAHEIEKLGGQAVAFTADVRNAEALDHAIRTVAETFGRLDGGANMAGYTGQTSLNSMGKEWDDMLGVNLSGVKNSIVSQLRYMKGTGSIVNAASISGQSGNPHFSAYSSSKWGVIGLTKSVAQEVGDRGIRVNAVAPGFVKTDLVKDLHLPAELEKGYVDRIALGKMADPEEITRVIVFLLSDEARYITSAVINIDGGYQ